MRYLIGALAAICAVFFTPLLGAVELSRVDVLATRAALSRPVP
jgi:hypothetical protein